MVCHIDPHHGNTTAITHLWRKTEVKTEYKTRIEYIRDTVRQFIPTPQTVFVERIDTVYEQVVLKEPGLAGDTLTLPVKVPIERKEYRTNDYYALIEGYRPSLLQLDIYREIPVVTNTQIQKTTHRQRLGVGLQAGYGFNGEKLQPYIGIGVQYNLFGW